MQPPQQYTTSLQRPIDVSNIRTTLQSCFNVVCWLVNVLQYFSELGFITFSLIFFPILFFVLREALFGRGYYTRVLSLGCLAYIFYSLIDLPNSSFANFNCFIFTLVLIYAYSRCSSGKRSFQKSS